MYYPLLYTYACMAVLPVLCLDMYGCAVCAVLRLVVYLYVQLCCVLGCVKMYGRAACAVPVPVCTAVLSVQYLDLWCTCMYGCAVCWAV